MNPEESKIVFDLLKDVRGKKILNVCSSDEQYYKCLKPHIWNHLMEPLLKKGNELINLDIKKKQGVDLPKFYSFS